MNWQRWVCLCWLGMFAGAMAAAQGKPSTADQKRTIRVGIALMENRSGRSVTPAWERDTLVRDLQRVRTDRKSSVILEAVPLESSSKEDAGPEATQKNCQYLVLTTMVDPRRGPGISGGPDGIARAPVILGNARPEQTLAIEFTILDTSDSRTLADGMSTVPVEENNDIRAADDAMQTTARRVAGELRRDRPPNID